MNLKDNNVNVLDYGPSWAAKNSTDFDTVVSSRVRLSRNLTAFKFPHLLNGKERSGVVKLISDATCSLLKTGYSLMTINGDQALNNRILMERNIISQEYSIENGNILIQKDDLSVSAIVNDIDHLRMASITGGYDLDSAYFNVVELDTFYEERLEYAVNLELGYLNTDINNIGTGLKASVMLHLPALERTGFLEKTIKAVMKNGHTVKGFYGDDDSSLGSMYQVSNQVAIGDEEPAIIRNLKSIVEQIIEYERSARTDLLKKERLQVEDEIFRAYGLLKHCRLISINEAVKNLSLLRLGVSLEMIDIPVEWITSLFFLVQKAHLQKYIELREKKSDNNSIEEVRAEVLRTILNERSGGLNV